VLPTLPDKPPFALRARLLTPLAGGGDRWEPDGVLEVDASGRIAWVGSHDAWRESETHEDRGAQGAARELIDLRPLLVVPGFVDLHVHLPQVPSAGLGAGLDLLTWLERHVFALERAFDRPTAERLVPEVFRAMAAVGTTTVVAYGAIWPDSMDAAFEAAEAHGIRAILGKVMMDRLSYDDALPPERLLDTSLRQSEELCARWNGAADGRLGYAFTPRFAVACSADMLRESASLAARNGAWWQSHLSEDRGEIARVAALFPEARDYLDVYDRAGALRARSVLAHAIHLSDREVGRLVESGAGVAHCPASNVFLSSGTMPLARYLDLGIPLGLGSDVAGAPELSMVTQMRTGFYVQSALRSMGGETLPSLDPLGWLRLATLGGAEALGLADVIGSLEQGKEADLVAVDARRCLPPGGEETDDPGALMSRIIFRERPGMVRGAWVRGRLLEAGPPAEGGGAAGAANERTGARGRR
jgi:guanine deaminase